MPLPTDYQDAVPPTGLLTELPATTSRGVNAINTQINTNTTAIAGRLSTSAVVDNTDGTIAVGAVNGSEPLGNPVIVTTSAAPAIGLPTYYNATAGNLTPTLPALSGLRVGARLAVRRDPADASTNTVTISCAGADTFYSSGATSFTLPLAGEQREFQVVLVSATKYWVPAGSLNPLTGLDARYGRAAKQYHVDNYGADPTGATFSDTALAAAITAMGAVPGVLMFGVGTYKLAGNYVFNDIPVSIKGQGIGQTVIRYVGTGVLFTVGMTVAPSPTETQISTDARAITAIGGDFTGIHFDGNGSTSACPLKVGDFTNMRVDLRIDSFSGGGGVGIWFYNNLHWAERMNCHVVVYNCDTCALIDANPANEVGGIASFMYGEWFFYLVPYGNQVGFKIQNGAIMHADKLQIVGACGPQPTSNSGAAMVFGNSSSDLAAITCGNLLISFETAYMHYDRTVGSSSDIGPKTIVVNNPANRVIQGVGVINFLTNSGLPAWQNGNANGHLAINGYVNIDTNAGKQGYWSAGRSIGLMTDSSFFINTGTGVLFMNAGNYGFAQWPSGATTISMATDPTGGTAGVMTTFQQGGQSANWDIFFKQPSSGAAATFTWPASWTWLEGVAPTPSTVNGAVDHIRVTTTDFVTFYARHVNANPLSKLDGRYVLDSVLTTKGDMIVASAANTPARQAIGADGSVLTANSGAANGATWTAPSTTTAVNNNNGTITVTGSVANNNNGTITLT